MVAALDQVGLDVLGRARRIVVTKDNTTIVDGAGDSSEVKARVAQLQAEIGVPTPTGIARSSKSGWPSYSKSL